MKKITFLIAFMNLFASGLMAQTGCNDSQASNYNPNAIINDGSCMYSAASVNPSASYPLNETLVETSGLIEWDGYLYTHNDNADTNIYQLNKSNGEIIKSIPLPNVTNIDWEEISQDQNYIYIGDFGNNVTGNRTNLKIYKILKSSLLTTPQIETINFSYSNQTDFTALTANNTDFDCEAMIVTSEGIFLFTKQWINRKTSIYQLSKNPGTHVANLLTTLNVTGLVTGATVKENLNLIALSGYSTMLSPFIYLIYDYKGTDFIVSNKRKINVSLSFHQVEGIATSNGLEYFLTNEKFTQTPISTSQKLHKISLNSYLENYITSLSNTDLIYKDPSIILYPNPTNGEITIESETAIGEQYKIIDNLGKIIKEGVLNNNTVNVSDFPKGIYIFTLPKLKQTYKIIKQ